MVEKLLKNQNSVLGIEINICDHEDLTVDIHLKLCMYKVKFYMYDYNMNSKKVENFDS